MWDEVLLFFVQFRSQFFYAFIVLRWATVAFWASCFKRSSVGCLNLNYTLVFFHKEHAKIMQNESINWQRIQIENECEWFYVIDINKYGPKISLSNMADRSICIELKIVNRFIHVISEFLPWESTLTHKERSPGRSYHRVRWKMCGTNMANGGPRSTYATEVSVKGR